MSCGEAGGKTFDMGFQDIGSTGNESFNKQDEEKFGKQHKQHEAADEKLRQQSGIGAKDLGKDKKQ